MEGIAAQHYDQTAVAQNEALEVLEKNVFEDWLDVQIIITSLEADYYSQLFALNQYYSQLYGQEVLASNNPVGPCVICHTFKQIMVLDQDRSIQAAVYSSFRDILSTKLKKLYHDLQLLFIENGYTANQKIAVAANANHSEQKNTVVNTVAAYEPHNNFDAVQAFKQLQHFIAKDKSQAYTEDECFKLDEINDWFSRLTLDKKLLLAGSDQPLREVFQDIIEAKGQGLPEGKHVKSEQLDILDVIDDIFGLMGATGELEPEIKAWLKQLKVPLIEVALNESQFFDDQYHPARQVVEQLVHLGSVDRVSNKNLEKTVKKHILDIVEHYEQDHTTFSRVSEELTKLIARQEKAFQRNADRVAKVHEGQQKLQRAKGKALCLRCA